ncbi:PREDICTED: ER membrane protein complex subunit 6 isoform X2 [Ceratosolen solmsi marchali]|uniref:ER membrane protein complex subunit 6 n=1 Tax=Ceratosolen solmsi marchali TaxID=326594 RepID=A0AAJ6YFE2_9HYME|nr:PREDICTED: ER membrane protein complex subunit 6 isoform X2 [Ceratosolen solmsi marchali]
MSGKMRAKQDKLDDIIAYSEVAVRNNAAVVEYCRISMAALSGGTAGLLGLTGFYGFGFYIFAILSLWGMLLMKAGGQWKKYFISRRSLLTNGFFGGLFISLWNGTCLLKL